MFADMPVGRPTRAPGSRRSGSRWLRPNAVEPWKVWILLENAVPARPRSTRQRPVGGHDTAPAVSTITTNVPGPQKQLYMLGRPMDRMLGYVPLGHEPVDHRRDRVHNGQICCGSPRTTTRCPTWKCWPTGSKQDWRSCPIWRAEPWTPGIPRRRPRTYRSAAGAVDQKCGDDGCPGPRTPEQRRAGDLIPIARLLPAPVHFVTAGWRPRAFSGGVAGAGARRTWSPMRSSDVRGRSDRRHHG